MVLNGLQHTLGKIDRFNIVALTKRGDDLIRAIHQHNPEIVLLDLNLPDQNGFTILEQIRKSNDHSKIIIFTSYEDDSLIEKARKLKANAYLLKDAEDDELISTLDRVEIGKFIIGKFHERKAIDKKVFKDQFTGKVKLTNREIDIINEIVKGKSTNAIADSLFLSPHTIETHRKNIFRKLEVNSTVELVNLVHEKGII